MRFLVDAQLPRSLDENIVQLALSDMRILVTKDEDFVDSFILRGLPPKLLFVTTGNISNKDLLALFQGFLPTILEALEGHYFVEIDRDGLTIHN